MRATQFELTIQEQPLVKRTNRNPGKPSTHSVMVYSTCTALVESETEPPIIAPLSHSVRLTRLMGWTQEPSSSWQPILP
jgi:hypothetical protein